MASSRGSLHSSNGQSFTFVSYNLLEQGLAFGAIPWVMVVPSKLQDEAENFKEVSKLLSSEYRNCWHKNMSAGNYKRFRRLWGERMDEVPCESDGSQGNAAVVTGLPAVTVMGTDEVEVSGRRCVTMRGILRRHLKAKSSSSDLDLAERVFAHVAEANRNAFAWPLRGQRLFDVCTNGYQRGGHGDDLAPLLDRFYGPSNEEAVAVEDSALAPTKDAGQSLPTVQVPRGTGADLIVVQEYDFHHAAEHSPALDYLGTGQKLGFGEAMAAAGYHAILFEGPKKDGAGIGVFARATRFRISSDAGAHAGAAASTTSERLPSSDGATVKTISPGDWAPGAALGAFDFQEVHHPCNSNPSEFSGAPVTVPLADRKHSAMALFDVLGAAGTPTGQRIALFGVHLMTTSRDNPEKVSAAPCLNNFDPVCQIVFIMPQFK
jgi:hypothetical protein